MEIDETMLRNILAFLNRVPLGTTPGTTMVEAAAMAQIHQVLQAAMREHDEEPKQCQNLEKVK